MAETQTLYYKRKMRIDHAALFCRDLEQMRQFFIDYFDARSNEQYHNPRTGLRTYILSFTEGSTRLELMQRTEQREPSSSLALDLWSLATAGTQELSVGAVKLLTSAGCWQSSRPGGGQIAELFQSQRTSRRHCFGTAVSPMVNRSFPFWLGRTGVPRKP